MQLQEAELSNVQNVRKLRGWIAVLMSPHWPKKSPVAPSYGRNIRPCGTAPALDLPSNRDEMAPTPKKKRPYLGPQGHKERQMGSTRPAFSVRSNLVGVSFA